VFCSTTRIAEPEENLLLDRSEQLQHVLHGHLARRSPAASWSSVETGVAERAAA